ncbi:tetratricopeptide repeat protein [Microseira wollei]|uniref:TPR repeat-containing protein n=1 Tax=Microseira wollei NIES-4236 TaxID=2530354 RepID=A0AAV3XQ08_9CYAN|nr:tetratricopeptide repeat protein [Microseira wollei]GET42607.1 TPR repeat-containing protein [Microseira wollei NIES-4236]
MTIVTPKQPPPPTQKPGNQRSVKPSYILVSLVAIVGVTFGMPKLLPISNLVPQSSLAIDFFNQGKQLSYLEQHQEAIAAYDQALKINPKYADAWNERGLALYSSQRSEEALAAFDKALEIDPNHYYAWSGRGIALKKLNRNQAATIAFEKALKTTDELLKKNNNNSQASYGKGYALVELDRHEEARNAYDKAV